MTDKKILIQVFILCCFFNHFSVFSEQTSCALLPLMLHSVRERRSMLRLNSNSSVVSDRRPPFPSCKREVQVFRHRAEHCVCWSNFIAP